MSRMSIGLGLGLLTACGGGASPANDGGEDSTNGDAGILLDAAPDGQVSDVPTSACSAPEGPYGTRVAARLEPFTLPTCSGEDYSFYNDDFCAATLTVVSIAAGWCPPCMREAAEMTETITEPYRDRGVRVIQVLTQDETYSEPTEDFCNAWVNTYGLTNIELMDPTQVTAIYFPGNVLPATIIVDSEGIIQFRENGAEEGLVSLRSALDELLDPDQN